MVNEWFKINYYAVTLVLVNRKLSIFRSNIMVKAMLFATNSL